MSWLDDVKIGDDAAVWLEYGRRVDICPVTRVTPTQVVVGVNRFKRQSGYQIGGSRWDRVRIEQPTPDLRHKANVQQALRTLSTIRWNEVPEAKMLAVYDCLRAKP